MHRSFVFMTLIMHCTVQTVYTCAACAASKFAASFLVQFVTRAVRSTCYPRRPFSSFGSSLVRRFLVRFVASTVVLDCLAELSVEPVRVEIRNNRNVRDVLIRRICFRS